MPVIEIIDQNDKSTTLKVMATYFDKEKPYDLSGEYFSPETWFGDELLTEKFAIYDHGLTELQNELADYAPPNPILGVMKFLEKNDRGRYFKLEIEKAHEYHDFIMELHSLGLLGASSRTLPGKHVKSVDANGHITRWPEVEISLTGTPAEARTAYTPEELSAYKGAIKSHLLPHLEKRAVDPADKKSDAVEEKPAAEPLPDLEAEVERILADAPAVEPTMENETVAALSAAIVALQGELAAQKSAHEAAMAEMKTAMTALISRVDGAEKGVVKNAEFVAQKMNDLKKSAAGDSDIARGILGLPPKEQVYTPPPAPKGTAKFESAFGPSAPGSN
jgi:hypothetical protein